MTVTKQRRTETPCFRKPIIKRHKKKNYSVIKLECLAIVWGSGRFRFHLYVKQVKIFSDNQAPPPLLKNECYKVRKKKSNFYKKGNSMSEPYSFPNWLRPNEKKTEDIRSLELPIYTKTLQSFLGAIPSFSNFIPDLSKKRKV